MKYHITNYRGGFRPHRFAPRPMVVVHQQPNLRLPNFMTQLSILCYGENGRKHPLPVRMNFAGPAVSQNGQLVARYVCPLCGRREFWALDGQTNRPFMLWFER